MPSRAHILAHRALTDGADADAENRVSSIHRAVRMGFGVEFDVVADGDRLVLSHDAVPWQADRDAATFLRDPGPGLHALNVKDLGTLDGMLAIIEDAGTAGSFFLFDLELAGGGRAACRAVMDGVARRGFIVAHRLSEREPYLDEVLADPPRAVWLDEWDEPWVEAAHIEALRAAGADTWYVSPELHHPAEPADLERRWREVLGFGVTGICTDHPRALRELARGIA